MTLIHDVVLNQIRRPSGTYFSAIGTNGPYTSGTYPLTMQNWGIDTKDGYRDSEFRIKLAKRTNATNPYVRKTYELVGSQEMRSSSVRWAPYSHWVSNGITSPAVYYLNHSVIPTNSWISDADDLALKRIKKKIASNISEFKALVPLGELKETRDLIRTTADSASELLKALIQLKRGNPKDLVKAVSGAWLQWSFGIAPTLGEIDSLLLSIDDYVNRQDFSVTHSGAASTSYGIVDKPVMDQVACQGGRWKTRERIQNVQYKVRYAAGLKINMRTGNNYGVQDQFGLTFGDIIPAFWELVPFSWVVDYFTTAGDFISDAFESSAGNTTYLVKSRKWVNEEILKFNIESNYGYNAWATSSTQTVGKTTIFTRDSLTNLPHRSFRIKSSDEIAANSVKRVLNLASILMS